MSQEATELTAFGGRLTRDEANDVFVDRPCWVLYLAGCHFHGGLMDCSIFIVDAETGELIESAFAGPRLPRVIYAPSGVFPQ